jgi:hypothetical protein
MRASTWAVAVVAAAQSRRATGVSFRSMTGLPRVI